MLSPCRVVLTPCRVVLSPCRCVLSLFRFWLYRHIAISCRDIAISFRAIALSPYRVDISGRYSDGPCQTPYYCYVVACYRYFVCCCIAISLCRVAILQRRVVLSLCGDMAWISQGDIAMTLINHHNIAVPCRDIAISCRTTSFSRYRFAILIIRRYGMAHIPPFPASTQDSPQCDVVTVTVTEADITVTCSCVSCCLYKCHNVFT